MDADRIAPLTRRLTARLRLRLLGAGLLPLATLPLVAGEPMAAKNAKKKKKCKKPCGECRKCQKGKCKPKPDGTDCGAGQVCQAGTCTCPPGQEDSGGVCAMPPICAGSGQPCSLPGGCCSFLCFIDSGGFASCEPSFAGQPCHGDSDCFAIGPIVCRGFICTVP